MSRNPWNDQGEKSRPGRGGGVSRMPDLIRPIRGGFSLRRLSPVSRSAPLFTPPVATSPWPFGAEVLRVVFWHRRVPTVFLTYGNPRFQRYHVSIEGFSVRAATSRLPRRNVNMKSKGGFK